MSVINGMTTVNGGTLVRFPNNLTVEAMGNGYSTHPTNMVALYTPEGSRKVELVYDGKAFYIFRFKSHSDLQHYWSTMKQINELIRSRKYSNMAKMAIEAYESIFIK